MELLMRDIGDHEWKLIKWLLFYGVSENATKIFSQTNCPTTN